MRAWDERAPFRARKRRMSRPSESGKDPGRCDIRADHAACQNGRRGRSARAQGGRRARIRIWTGIHLTVRSLTTDWDGSTPVCNYSQGMDPYDSKA